VHLSLTALLLTATLAASVWTEHRGFAALALPLDAVAKDIAGWVSTRDQQLSDNIVAR